MSSDRLAIERVAWAVSLKTRLKEVFSLRETLQDHSTTFVVKHNDTPDWEAKVVVRTEHNTRNRVELNDHVFGYSFVGGMHDKLIELLHRDRARHMAELADVKRQELESEAWLTRQRQELHGINEIGTVCASIIRSGPHAGEYCVHFYDGHPLEHLTLAQLKVFYLFLSAISSNKSANVHAEPQAPEKSRLAGNEPVSLARVPAVAAGGP